MALSQRHRDSDAWDFDEDFPQTVPDGINCKLERLASFILWAGDYFRRNLDDVVMNEYYGLVAIRTRTGMDIHERGKGRLPIGQLVLRTTKPIRYNPKWKKKASKTAQSPSPAGIS